MGTSCSDAVCAGLVSMTRGAPSFGVRAAFPSPCCDAAPAPVDVPLLLLTGPLLVPLPGLREARVVGPLPLLFWLALFELPAWLRLPLPLEIIEDFLFELEPEPSELPEVDSILL